MERVDLTREEMLDHIHETFHQMFDEVSTSPEESAMLFAIVVPRENALESFEAMFFGEQSDNIRLKMIEALERLLTQLKGAH